ncbi:MAG: hypothetical protein NVS9B3_05360 [Gemmatimonadaceae bacterium]
MRMHGLIVNQLRQYVVSKAGRDAWHSIAKTARVPTGEGPPPINSVYPDDLVLAVIAAAVAHTKIDRALLLEDFGAFLAPALLRVYGPLLDSAWRTLDVIENTETRIHTTLRRTDAHASPPRLSTQRVSPDEVTIVYHSERRLCAVAEGIARGLAEHFEETVEVEQTRCMERGDAQCVIRVRRV